MTSFLRIVRAELRDVRRSRWLPGYALVFLLLTDLLFRFGGGGERVLLSLLNVVLLLVPLVAIVVGTMHVHQSREFVELLLAQPVGRTPLFAALWAGLTLPMVAAFVVGVGAPFLWHGVGQAGATLATLLRAGAALTSTFTALAFLVAVTFEDRAAGLGAALLIWLLLAVVYDGIILIGTALLVDYPLEGPVLAAIVANPIDLARVLLLLRIDIAALMGYTGAVFERFFGGAMGTTVSAAALLLWVAIPLALAVRRFAGKDL
jgi:Cu-processing system permease protein